MVEKFSDATMGRYAIEPDNATKSAKAKVRFNPLGVKVDWLEDDISICT